MQKSARKYLVFITMLLLVITCRKPYLPVVLVKGDNYLVVDGFINTAFNGITTIVLSRTRNLADTVVSIQEHNAKVTLQNAAGTSYPLQELKGDGVYTSNALQLPANAQYKIAITASNGKRYASDLVAVKKTPPVDSISWKQDTAGVHVFANTHDPLNNTRYYRWQYIQTWEYHAQLESPWSVANNVIYVRDLNDQLFICYRTTPSTKILLGNSAALSQDVISLAPLFNVPVNDSTLAYRMSIEVKQYAMTPPAYFYWQIIQKNSEELGTLFDLQPSQLEGNIHCIDNSSEPVVGFVSAGTEETKRIFIGKADLDKWTPAPGAYNCLVKDIEKNPIDFSIWTFADTSYVPWYFSGGALRIAKKTCIDCRVSGGTTVKPSFW